MGTGKPLEQEYSEADAKVYLEDNLPKISDLLTAMGFDMGEFYRLDKTEQIKTILDVSKKKKTERSTMTLIPGLIHHIRVDEQVWYLMKSQGRLAELQYHRDDSGNMHQPKQELKYKIVSEAILEKEYCGDPLLHILVEQIIDFIKTYVEIKDDEVYLILALWVMHTYIVEKSAISPYIYFYGPTTTGKSRASYVLSCIDFRGKMVTSPTEAGLFRFNDYFRPVFHIDELQLFGMRGRSDVRDLLLSRYQRISGVDRIDSNKSGEEQFQEFDVYGPTVISTTESADHLIENRSFIFHMHSNKNEDVECDLWENDEFKNAALSLREDLTLFRAEFLDRTMPKPKKLANRRLWDLCRALYQICEIACPDRADDFKTFIKQQERELKESKTRTKHAEIIQHIYDEMNFRKGGKKKYWHNFTSELICIRYNATHKISEQITNTEMGRIISGLGFEAGQMVKIQDNDVTRVRGFKFDKAIFKEAYNDHWSEYPEGVESMDD